VAFSHCLTKILPPRYDETWLEILFDRCLPGTGERGTGNAPLLQPHLSPACWNNFETTKGAEKL